MKPFNQELEELIKEIKLQMYPVGSIFINTTNKNPSSFIGGTWVAWGAGRVPVGVDTGDSNFNSTEKTGGSNTTNIAHIHSISGNTGGHALTVNEIPTHAHTYEAGRDTGNQSTAEYALKFSNDMGWGYANKTGLNTGSTGKGQAHNHSVSLTSGSSGGNISIIQKYITCYMWKRTA